MNNHSIVTRILQACVEKRPTLAIEAALELIPEWDSREATEYVNSWFHFTNPTSVSHSEFLSGTRLTGLHPFINKSIMMKWGVRKRGLARLLRSCNNGARTSMTRAIREIIPDISIREAESLHMQHFATNSPHAAQPRAFIQGPK
jgi:hypothetical protein